MKEVLKQIANGRLFYLFTNNDWSIGEKMDLASGLVSYEKRLFLKLLENGFFNDCKSSKTSEDETIVDMVLLEDYNSEIISSLLSQGFKVNLERDNDKFKDFVNADPIL